MQVSRYGPRPIHSILNLAYRKLTGRVIIVIVDLGVKLSITLADWKKFGNCHLVALRGITHAGTTSGRRPKAASHVLWILSNMFDPIMVITSLSLWQVFLKVILQLIRWRVWPPSRNPRSGRARVAKNEAGFVVVTVCQEANFQKDMTYLKEDGSQFVITQMFLDAEVYLHFVSQAHLILRRTNPAQVNPDTLFEYEDSPNREWQM